MGAEPNGVGLVVVGWGGGRQAPDCTTWLAERLKETTASGAPLNPPTRRLCHAACSVCPPRHLGCCVSCSQAPARCTHQPGAAPCPARQRWPSGPPRHPLLRPLHLSPAIPLMSSCHSLSKLDFVSCHIYNSAQIACAFATVKSKHMRRASRRLQGGARGAGADSRASACLGPIELRTDSITSFTCSLTHS